MSFRELTATNQSVLAASAVSPAWRSLPAKPRLRVISGLGLLLLARLLFTLLCPLELIPDEAYYWDWSRQLDWSYYSKPPLIAWLIAATTSLLGESEFTIRIPAAIAGTLGLWFVYELGRAMYGHQTGLRALILVGVSPGLSALCLLMTIDAPFLLAWTLAIYCLWKMLGSGTPDPRWLLPSIWASGFALLSKQSALGIFPLVALYLMSAKQDRQLLRSPIVALWTLGSLACLLPVFLWNQSHAWVTVDHTRGHLNLQSASLVRHIGWYLEFAVSQFGILSPLIAGLTVIGMARLTLTFFRLDRRERFLVCFGGAPLVAVTILSFFQRVQPNWPVALHLTPVVAVAAWSSGQLSFGACDRLKSALPAGVMIGIGMSILALLTLSVVPATSLSGTTWDLTARLRGWRDLSAQVSEKLHSAACPSDALVVAATSRGPVSELAYYLPGRPRVYRWNVGEIVDSQHDVWGGPTNAEGHDAVIITEAESPVPARLARAFEDVKDLGSVKVVVGPHKTRHFRVWLGANLQAWPERLPTGPLADSSHQLIHSKMP